jgi:hypothetical protein
MAALLVQAAVTRMHLLEASQRGERVGHATEVALTDGGQVKNIPVLGNLRKERLGCREGRGELTLFQQFPGAKHLRLDRGYGRIRFRLSHPR